MKSKSVFLAFLVVLIFALTAFAGTVQLPQTGQTKCYDSAGAEIACAGTGQDGDIRAGVAWPEPRFVITYCNATAPCADQSSDCDANPSTDVVTDKLTGLMWPKNGNLAGAMTWYSAIDYANNLTLCGHSDWRLPNVNELESLVNSNMPYANAWLNTQGFNNVLSSYWSSTTYAKDIYSAWYVAMHKGYVVHDIIGKGDTGSYAGYAWAVRSEQFSSVISLPQTGQKTSYASGDDGDIQAGVVWPSPRFTDNDNSTVTDNLTGLIWTKDANVPGPSACNPGTYKTWQEALEYIKCLNSWSYLGHHDWRLPNKKELYSLIDYSNYNPALL